jgi:RNA polymerase sigma-54 factor
MQMGFGLYQEQTQKLVMTVQMKQAIEVLQCSALELNEYVASFVEENPCAEFEPLFRDKMLSFANRATARTGSPTGTHAAPPLEQVVQVEQSLQQMLEDQIGLSSLDPLVQRVVRYLIGCLDEHGYLTEGDETFATLLGVPVALVEEAITVLQACEPPGIAARNIRECLKLQIQFVPRHLQSLVSTLIDNHLHDIASGKTKQIGKTLCISLPLVQEGIDALRRLNPKPGLQYASSRPVYVLPDVTVEKVGSQFIVFTNDRSYPMIRMSPSYLRMLNHSDIDTSAYITKKMQSAEWLTRCLEQRRLTLFRVAEAIVEKQQAFFHFGRASMRPLTLRQIAEELSLHESTVSRATRGKYMQTPRGVFEMKFFFTAELAAENGSTSAEAAKYQIRQYVSAENKLHPHSDEALVTLLANEGIVLSRRTVAKYREELNIPGSAKRKRYS